MSKLVQWHLRFLRLLSLPRLAALRLRGADVQFNSYVSWRSHFPIFCRGIHLGNHIQVGANTALSIACADSGTIRIGDRTGIGRNCIIHAKVSVNIGEDCLFSDGIYISDSQHIVGRDISPISSGIKYVGEITIGSRCFIGRNVTISPGVTLGSNCVVGAGAVVTKSFPANSVIGGVPAKLIKSL
jgi:acetyltransferase-like isoleucine patch superfamily enzyme